MGLMLFLPTLRFYTVCAVKWVLLALVFSSPVVCMASASQAVKVEPVLRLIPSASQITFVARQIGVPMEGRFKRFSASLRLDPRQVEKGQVEVRVDMASVSLSADGEDLLQDVAWFNSAKFPQAVFVSRQIKSIAPGKLEVSGVFTLKGISQPLKILVSLMPLGDLWVVKGDFVLPRLAYQVGAGDWADTAVIANDVQVHFSWQLQSVKNTK